MDSHSSGSMDSEKMEKSSPMTACICAAKHRISSKNYKTVKAGIFANLVESIIYCNSESYAY